MPRTITLTNLSITSLTYSPAESRMVVSYQLSDASGRGYESGEAVFWAGVPAYPAGVLPPDNWYTLPALKATQLTQLTDMVSAALAKLLT